MAAACVAPSRDPPESFRVDLKFAYGHVLGHVNNFTCTVFSKLNHFPF